MFNTKNSQIVNPVTGRAYEYGDAVPDSWRDLAYPNPLDRGEPPTDPARYTQGRQILYGISFNFNEGLCIHIASCSCFHQLASHCK